jgi:hypothetical protein
MELEKAARIEFQNFLFGNKRFLCKILGFHGDVYEESRLLGSGAV